MAHKKAAALRAMAVIQSRNDLASRFTVARPSTLAASSFVNVVLSCMQAKTSVWVKITHCSRWLMAKFSLQLRAL